MPAVDVRLFHTGVQIHSWGKEQNDGTPNLEYVQPVSAYSVVGGERKSLNLSNIPTLTPRQQREVLQARGGNGAFAPEEVCFLFSAAPSYGSYTPDLGSTASISYESAEMTPLNPRSLRIHRPYMLVN